MSGPNFASIELGAANRRLAKMRSAQGDHGRQYNLALAVEHFEVLDRYLREGGELPEEWRNAQPWVGQ